MSKRTIEFFTAGCPCCDEALRTLETLVCPSCELKILDMRNDPAAQAQAKQYGIHRVPAIVVDGKLADCCPQRAVDRSALKAMGVGVP